MVMAAARVQTAAVEFFDALERDQAALLNSRRWKLAHAEAHVFFPGSDHVETLAVYDAVAPE